MARSWGAYNSYNFWTFVTQFSTRRPYFMLFGEGIEASTLSIPRAGTASVWPMFDQPLVFFPLVTKDPLHAWSPALFIRCCFRGVTLTCCDLLVSAASLVHVSTFLQRVSMACQAATSGAIAPPAIFICPLLPGMAVTRSIVRSSVPRSVQSACIPELDW